MAVFSRATQYGIRALALLAAQPPGKLTGAQEIATRQKIPKPFLWKVLYRLQRKKLVRSFKGVGGGYELAHAPRTISLLEVVEALATKPIFQQCPLGRQQCPKTAECALKPGCATINDYILKWLKRNTLADLGGHEREQKHR